MNACLYSRKCLDNCCDWTCRYTRLLCCQRRIQTLYWPRLHKHATLYCWSVLSRTQFRNHIRYCNCCLRVFSFAGITTVLTMTFLGLEARTDLPKVPYPTALDFFVFLSFSFIFATIIQVSKLYLTLILLTWTIWRAPTNASKWRMGFNTYPANVDNMASSYQC